MKIKGTNIKLTSLMCLAIYYGFAQYLPTSLGLFGKQSKWLRYKLCKHIFLKCGENVNIERKAHFGSGKCVQIGDNSGLGINCNIPSNTIIGEDVMMGPNCYILGNNHSFDRTDIPMRKQGYKHKENLQTIIDDDVWIGRDVLMTPGRHILKGSVIGGGLCCVRIFQNIA